MAYEKEFAVFTAKVNGRCSVRAKQIKPNATPDDIERTLPKSSRGRYGRFIRVAATSNATAVRAGRDHGLACGKKK